MPKGTEPIVWLGQFLFCFLFHIRLISSTMFVAMCHYVMLAYFLFLVNTNPLISNNDIPHESNRSPPRVNTGNLSLVFLSIPSISHYDRPNWTWSRYTKVLFASRSFSSLPLLDVLL
jgi:hypothetical protein